MTATDLPDQARTFTYDGRGFLVSEDLPEKSLPSTPSSDRPRLWRTREVKEEVLRPDIA